MLDLRPAESVVRRFLIRRCGGKAFWPPTGAGEKADPLLCFGMTVLVVLGVSGAGEVAAFL